MKQKSSYYVITGLLVASLDTSLLSLANASSSSSSSYTEEFSGADCCPLPAAEPASPASGRNLTSLAGSVSDINSTSSSSSSSSSSISEENITNWSPDITDIMLRYLSVPDLSHFKIFGPFASSIGKIRDSEVEAGIGNLEAEIDPTDPVDVIFVDQHTQRLRRITQRFLSLQIFARDEIIAYRQILKKVKGSINDFEFLYSSNSSYPDLENAFSNGVISAIHEKIERLSEDTTSSASLSRARELNDRLIGKGNFCALRRKIKALEEGKFGYKSLVGPYEDQYQARRIIAEGIKDNQVWAFQSRLEHLRGLQQIPEAIKLADDFAAQSNDAGNFAKLDLLLSPISVSYTDTSLDGKRLLENSMKGRDMIEKGLETNEPWAILAKVEGLLLGKWHFDINQEAGLELAQKQYSYAYHYLKAVRHWLGGMGSEKNIEEAKRIMQANGIVF